MLFKNFTRKNSNAIRISLVQVGREFDFLSPALHIFLKGYPARTSNVFPISQETVGRGLNCTSSDVNVLRRTPGSCVETPRQKN